MYVERRDGISSSVDRRAWGWRYMSLRYNRRDRGEKQLGCTQCDLRLDLVLLKCSCNDISEVYVPGFLFRDQKVHRMRRGGEEVYQIHQQERYSREFLELLGHHTLYVLSSQGFPGAGSTYMISSLSHSR